MAARYSEIEEYIMNKIHTGEWPVGYMIPKEVELCDQFGVSRSTVRTAMLRLVQEGHLKRVKRKGTFVTLPVFWRIPRYSSRAFSTRCPQRDRGRDRGAGVPLYGGDGGVGGEVR